MEGIQGWRKTARQRFRHQIKIGTRPGDAADNLVDRAGRDHSKERKGQELHLSEPWMAT